MGGSNDARDNDLRAPGEPEPKARQSGMHLKCGRIVDVVSQVGQRLKNRQRRAALDPVDSDESSDA